MIITKADEKDLEQITAIVDDAKAYLRQSGIQQWQDGYPNEETFKNDIAQDRLYVVRSDGRVIAVFAIVDYEKTYDIIYEGEWLDDTDYIAVHRIAVANDEKGKGIAGYIFDELKKENRHIRVDTHKDNRSMQKCLLKNGFKYCGIIYLDNENSDPVRLAYEYID